MNPEKCIPCDELLLDIKNKINRKNEDKNPDEIYSKCTPVIVVSKETNRSLEGLLCETPDGISFEPFPVKLKREEE